MPKRQRFRVSTVQKILSCRESAIEEPRDGIPNKRAAERSGLDTETVAAPVRAHSPEHAFGIPYVSDIPEILVRRLQKLPELAESDFNLLFATERSDDCRVPRVLEQFVHGQFFCHDFFVLNLRQEVLLEIISEPADFDVVNRFAWTEFLRRDELANCR